MRKNATIYEKQNGGIPNANQKKTIAKKKSATSGIGATVTKTNRSTGKSTTTNKKLTPTSSSSFNGSGSIAMKKTAAVRKKTGNAGNSSVTTPGFKPQTQKKYY